MELPNFFLDWTIWFFSTMSFLLLILLHAGDYDDCHWPLPNDLFQRQRWEISLWRGGAHIYGVFSALYNTELNRNLYLTAEKSCLNILLSIRFAPPNFYRLDRYESTMRALGFVLFQITRSTWQALWSNRLSFKNIGHWNHFCPVIKKNNMIMFTLLHFHAGERKFTNSNGNETKYRCRPLWHDLARIFKNAKATYTQVGSLLLLRLFRSHIRHCAGVFGRRTGRKPSAVSPVGFD